MQELALSPAQVGISNALTSGAICISTITIGSAAEKRGKIFSCLTLLLLIGAAAVLLLGMASGFPAILISRVLLGIGCGPLFALTMKSVAIFSLESTYPRNAGIVSNGEAFINTILGPVIIVFLLNKMGFRSTNYLFSLLLVALAVAWLLIGRRVSVQQAPINTEKKHQVMTILKNSGLRKCLLCGSMALVACWCIYMYVPSLLQSTGTLTDTQMSFIMTAMGIFMSVWMVVLPAIYASGTRKWVVIAGCLLGALGIGVLIVSADHWVSIALFILFGGLSSVVSLFYMAIFSVELIEPEQTAAALALVNGGCELLGASLGPMLAGWIAERADLRISMLIPTLSLVCAALITRSIHSPRKAAS